MVDKEKNAYSEQSSNLITIQKGNHEIIINDDGIFINSESGKLHFLNQ